MDYRDSEYRSPAPRQALPPAGHGEHPYAAFSAAGYGDDGYRDPSYDGPASQDAGIAGTRTVRGFVEARQERPGYALPAAPQTGYPQPGYRGDNFGQPGYGPSGRAELPYPMPLPAETYPAADTYRQPWDYDQPLRYDGEQAPYPAADGYRAQDGYQQQADYGRADGYGQADNYDQRGFGSGAYRTPAYDPAQYNGSDYSMPGINGPGYDLSGIIGTGDFEAFGYDEPSYDRLSYDDPRYDDKPGHGGSRYDALRDDMPRDYGQNGHRFDETRFDVPRFDETRLDNLWPGEDDGRRGEPVGYGNDGFGTDSPVRSDYSDFNRGSNARFDETRLDLRVNDLRMNQTRFDMPALGPTAGLRPAGTGLLAPPDDRPRSWAEETSLDTFGDLNLDEEFAQVPAAFVRTAEREDDTAARRAVGRRRGRSGDRRQWMALGAIAVVAAGAIGGVLMKYVFSGPSGPAHTVVAPNQADAFTRMPSLEKQMRVDALRENVMQTSAGQATNVVSAVYQQGSSAPGSNPQIFMFVGGHLSSASPPASIANFTQHYPGAQVVPAGPMGGEAACAEAHSNGESVAMCVWFDNDSFGELVSPTMTTAKLATTMNSVRANLELYAK